MLNIIVGTLLVLSRLAAAVLAFSGLVTLFISVMQEDFFIFEQALFAFILAVPLALLARLLRRFEL